MGGGGLFGFSGVGVLGTWGMVGAGVVWDVGVERFGSGSSVRGLGMVVSVVCLRVYAFGDGFQPLHWNMLS